MCCAATTEISSPVNITITCFNDSEGFWDHYFRACNSTSLSHHPGKQSCSKSITPHLSPTDDARLILGLEPVVIVAVMEASTTDMSDAFWVQDSRLESLRANLASLASETDSVARGRSAQGGRDGGAQWATPSASLVGKARTEVLDILTTHIAGRTA